MSDRPSSASQGGLDLEVLDRLIPDAHDELTGDKFGIRSTQEILDAVPALIAKVKELEAEVDGEHKLRMAYMESTDLYLRDRERVLEEKYTLTARLASLERLREMAGALVESWGDNTDPRREPTVENDLRAALADSEEGRDDHMPDRDPEETGSKSSSREGQ